LTQLPLQRVASGPHAPTQCPWIQTSVEWHIVPHVPQLVGLVATSTGRPWQLATTPPGVNVAQLPLRQLVPAGQTTPGPPQFRLSEA